MVAAPTGEGRSGFFRGKFEVAHDRSPVSRRLPVKARMAQNDYFD
jgi:hypothetical protein